MKIVNWYMSLAWSWLLAGTAALTLFVGLIIHDTDLYTWCVILLVGSVISLQIERLPNAE